MAQAVPVRLKKRRAASGGRNCHQRRAQYAIGNQIAFLQHGHDAVGRQISAFGRRHDADGLMHIGVEALALRRGNRQHLVALQCREQLAQRGFAAFAQLSLSVSGGIEAPMPTQGMQESALILGEFYRRQGVWKFRCVAQGFAGGLAPLAEHFGVDIAAPAPIPAAAPAPAATPAPAPAAPKVNLSKITLDKQRPSINLDKKDGDFGEIKINLNWNRGTSSGGGGFFASLRGKSGGIDLDVGCLYEMENGRKGAVQALGNAFGDFRDEPFIQLMGDDRTGAASDGEWLRINGKEWRKMRRVLVYAFIYEGAPNWQATDGVITLYIPGEPPIEVRLSEEGGSKGMCAIALLENVGGSVRVNRKIEFFKGHSDMDKAFNWGMRWSAGSK